MKQKLLWFDLVVCSLWAIFALGSRTLWFAHPTAWLVPLTLMARITFSFAFYEREKRSWLPLLLFLGLTFLSITGGQYLGIKEWVTLPFSILGVDYDLTTSRIFGIGVMLWLWIVPIVAFIIALCRKKFPANTLSWKEASGCLLWKDKRAKSYCALLLVTIGTLYAGLAMDARLCLFACLTAPALSGFLLKRYYGLSSIRLWFVALAMAVFFFAQTHVGIGRIALLIISFATVVYVCSQFYKVRNMLVLSILSSLYLGILLPCLAIGNNPYVCINEGRVAYNSLDTYNGIFYIENKRTEKIGLRDRYGLLVTPEYDDIVYHTARHWFGELELRRNGYVTLYDICNNTCRPADDISHSLQDSICYIIKNHLTDNAYQYDDRLEVKVTDYSTDKTIAHVKALKNGPVFYDYSPEPYIPINILALKSGETCCDSLVQFQWSQKQVLCYAYDVRKDSLPTYRIQVMTAKDDLSRQEEAVQLANKVALLLKP